MHRKLFSTVSHDLKTPLSSMIGSLEIHQRLHAKLSEDKKMALIETALIEAYRLDNFVTNILDMAKLESGMVKPRLGEFDLEALIRDCTLQMSHRVGETTITLARMNEDALSGTSDPVLLCRALALLLDNAVKYGGRPPIIRIHFGRISPTHMAISVHDNGNGVPENAIETIFEKYTRFTKSDTQNAGTGLGLPICRELMRVLGGTVHVTNHPEGGAEFTLHFPA